MSCGLFAFGTGDAARAAAVAGVVEAPAPDATAAPPSTLIGIGSLCTVFGFASLVIVKFPIAPEKLGGAFGGNGFTSSATGSLLISTSRRSPNWLNGFEKNGSENGSS